MAIQCRIDKTAPIPIDTLDHPGYSFIAKLGLRRHYSVRAGWDHAGFFVDDARNIDDLVTFWNLRAADIQLQFIDPEHLGRYAIIKPEFEKRTVAYLADLDEHRRQIAIWSRSENIEEVLKPFSGQPVMACRVSGRAAAGTVEGCCLQAASVGERDLFTLPATARTNAIWQSAFVAAPSEVTSESPHEGATGPDVAAKPLWLNLITQPATNPVLAN
jgi:hypothetical protein